VVNKRIYIYAEHAILGGGLA